MGEVTFENAPREISFERNWKFLIMCGELTLDDTMYDLEVGHWILYNFLHESASAYFISNPGWEDIRHEKSSGFSGVFSFKAELVSEI